MDDREALKSQLDTLSEQIRKAQISLKIKGIYDQGHEATSEELLERAQTLAKSLDDEIEELKERGITVDRFQKTVLIWLNEL